MLPVYCTWLSQGIQEIPMYLIWIMMMMRATRRNESSHFRWCRYPKASVVLNNKDQREERGHRGTVITDYWCSDAAGADDVDESQEGLDGVIRNEWRGASTDSLIVLSQKMLGCPGDAEDYPEINSKRGMTLLTSQGSALQYPHGTRLPIQPGITADLVWRRWRREEKSAFGGSK